MKSHMWFRPNNSHFPTSTIPTMRHGSGSAILWTGMCMALHYWETSQNLGNDRKGSMIESAKDLKLGRRLIFYQKNGHKSQYRDVRTSQRDFQSELM